MLLNTSVVAVVVYFMINSIWKLLDTPSYLHNHWELRNKILKY